VGGGAAPSAGASWVCDARRPTPAVNDRQERPLSRKDGLRPSGRGEGAGDAAAASVTLCMLRATSASLSEVGTIASPAGARRNEWVSLHLGSNRCMEVRGPECQAALLRKQGSNVCVWGVG
jgi:hypothetical protein